jgi:hypothetical protein
MAKITELRCENFKRLTAELAEEHDAKLWLERAGHSDPGAVVIEDGAVAERTES